MKDLSKMSRKEVQKYMTDLGEQRRAEQEQKDQEAYLVARAQQREAERRDSKQHTRPVVRITEDGRTAYRERL